MNKGMDVEPDMPDWFKELVKAVNDKNRKITPEKQAIIDYLKEQIKELEGN